MKAGRSGFPPGEYSLQTGRLFPGLESGICKPDAVQYALEIPGVALGSFQGIDALCAQGLSVF